MAGRRTATRRRRYRKRNFRNLKTKAKTTLNNNVATRALSLAKFAVRNIQKRSWYVTRDNEDLSLTDNPTIDSVDMTNAGAMAAGGWKTTGPNSAVYTGTSKGMHVFTVGHMGRETTSAAPGYRTGNMTTLLKYFAKLKLVGASAVDTTMRVMLVKYRGAMISPDDFPLLWTSVATTPDLNGFVVRGNGVYIKAIYNRLIKLDSTDNPDIKKTTKHIFVTRRLNQHMNYRAPATKGSATTDPLNAHDVSNGSYSYAWVILTNQTGTPAPDAGAKVYLQDILTYVP